MQNIEIGNFEHALDRNLKPDWRACGLALATRPPKVDGADRGTPRHFNIIAYGLILGDEWRFSRMDFLLRETLNPKIAPSRLGSVAQSTCHFSTS